MAQDKLERLLELRDRIDQLEEELSTIRNEHDILEISMLGLRVTEDVLSDMVGGVKR